MFYFSDIFSPQFLGNMDQGVVINLIKKVRPSVESLTVYKGDGAALYSRGLNVNIFRRGVLHTGCGDIHLHDGAAGLDVVDGVVRLPGWLGLR